ncbi:MAG: AraC family transcriptional regulator [Puniceicoccaceae bacterium]
MPQSLKQLLQDPFRDGQLTVEVFELIRTQYRSATGKNLVYTDTDGNLIQGIPDCDEFPCIESCRQARKLAIDSALTHQFPYHTRCPISYSFWALPVHLNNHVIGALISVESNTGNPCTAHTPDRESDESNTLLELAERFNIINRALLDQQRRILDPELHQKLTSRTPNQPNPDLSTLWTRQVVPLLHSIASEDIALVRRKLHLLLQCLQSSTDYSLIELRGFALELLGSVISHCLRENGHRQSCFRYHCETANAILKCDDVDGLCTLLEAELGGFLNAQRHRIRSHDKTTLISKVYSYIETHLNRPISREQVAQHVGISPSRLSHILKEEVHESYSEILTRFRLEHARKLLMHSDEAISSIASESGYFDQSHFSKAFHKRYGVAPLEYRKYQRSH